MAEQSPIRIGILGAARIGKSGLIDPARSVPEVAVVGVAARDPERARHYAARHGLAHSFESYDAMLADPNIDAVYNPLPNSLHAEWTIRALKAGKHVLCEKPFAANAEEAERMAQAASETGKVLSEAFHFRYHPLLARVKSILASGEIGTVRHLEAAMCFPLPMFGDIRYRYELAGGSLMDAGSYPVSLIRFLADAEPEVTGAQAVLISPQVDRAMRADFRFADGPTARMMSSMWSRVLLRIFAVVKGDAGELRIHNPYHPQWFHRLYIQGRNGKRVERVPGDSSYVYGLRAFAKAIREGAPLLTGPADSIANMRVIDSIYMKAGLKRRGT
ncbi:MAG TPA: Gfo/Idh/MocA family oxidoreductase [Aggregatilineales bacterium]|nr:Gfo/Idh/MocA family oxidoreductase [Aggregatilineales bacterium]